MNRHDYAAHVALRETAAMPQHKPRAVRENRRVTRRTLSFTVGEAAVLVWWGVLLGIGAAVVQSFI